MSALSVASLKPVARRENLDRLFLHQRTALSEVLWNQLHDEVQLQLQLLEAEVRRKLAGLRTEVGRTKGSTFFLFSHRTFSVPENGLDPVVAGMTFTKAEQGVTVEADVSGEQIGDFVYTVPRKIVAPNKEELLLATRESARTLTQSAEAIANSLRNPSRKVE
jgi:hypothetical protein